MTKFTKLFFFGNVSYGLCAVALSIESNVQLRLPLNSTLFYLLVFLAPIVYYGRIYYYASFHSCTDSRLGWYNKNRKNIGIALLISCLMIVTDVLYFVFSNYLTFFKIPFLLWLLVASVLLASLLYTFQAGAMVKLRRIGWLKPFVIGFVWAGIVTVVPLFFIQMTTLLKPADTLLPLFFFLLNNFLFISALAIIFDVKDFIIDKQYGLYTLPARFNIKNTLGFIVVPIALMSFISLLYFLEMQGVSYESTVLQAVPYGILLMLLRKINTGKSLLFYLAGIDGLMFLKAICGIISIKLL